MKLKNQKFYKLKLLSLERSLPVLTAPSGIKIAGFNCVGDMELLEKAGEYLAERLKNLENLIILTTELKGLPIAQEVARNLKCDYVCLRKQAKCYMLNPLQVESESITSGKSSYFIGEEDLYKLRNKKVIFVDDVFSTGATLLNMIKFSNQADFKLVAGAVILKECEKGQIQQDKMFYFNNIPIYFCQYLPLQ